MSCPRCVSPPVNPEDMFHPARFPELGPLPLSAPGSLQVKTMIWVEMNIKEDAQQLELSIRDGEEGWNFDCPFFVSFSRVVGECFVSN